ncbi:MAG: nickel pincer cofactor biosynthesis protein LarB [Candidatus Omnitrophica bacterium]|nr:nickel pincer cofactor biosynthesis protein LarB [Candidatus Omnitrophota bacterium]MCM8793694.1 nickel pincer cofactor biosynthesis protein LarB [Candidatus Omnitrophota bacterium]
MKIKSEKFLKKFNGFFYKNLGFARIDAGRKFRKGFPEVIYAPCKTIEQLGLLVKDFLERNEPLLITKLKPIYFKKLSSIYPDLKYNPLAKICYHRPRPVKLKGRVVIVTGGTGDIPVAEEAAITLEILGSRVIKIYDVGVAGVHRLLDKLETLRKARVMIVIAGMDGVLASLVSGLVKQPVIAVPTSVGYGASFKGIAPLLTMLNSCSPGVAVVNIDNGFGAGYFAHLINTI